MQPAVRALDGAAGAVGRVFEQVQKRFLSVVDIRKLLLRISHGILRQTKNTILGYMFLAPLRSPEDWKQFLADPVLQWKDGYSAKSLAESWHNAGGFPESVLNVFRASTDTHFSDLEFLLGIPEYKVVLPGGSRASQNDLFVLARGAGGLVAIMVEGKCEEPFGPIVADWIANASVGKQTRLTYLLSELGIRREDSLTLRYQLLHRAVSAVQTARQFGCVAACMLVHSFSPLATSFSDFAQAAKLLGLTARPNWIGGPIDANGMPLFFGWVSE